MPRVRMLVDHLFEAPSRAPLHLRRGDFFFLDDERAAEWLSAGMAQGEDEPFPPTFTPTLVDAQGRPLRRDVCV